nr:zinc-binding dehydrogenase [Tessaracoccus sp. OS52]
MAVQISAAMGAETHVLSRTRSKEADGLALGAVAYHATSEDGTLRSLRNSFDLLICTVSDGIDLNALLKTLDVDGALVVVGLPAEPTGVDLGNVIHRNRALAGSNIGGLPETQEMLDFCAEKGIRPMVEIIGGDEIDRAYDDVVASRVRYRFVIDAATLDAR